MKECPKLRLEQCDDKTNKALLDNDVINKDKLPEAMDLTMIKIEDFNNLPVEPNKESGGRSEGLP